MVRWLFCAKSSEVTLGFKNKYLVQVPTISMTVTLLYWGLGTQLYIISVMISVEYIKESYELLDDTSTNKQKLARKFEDYINTKVRSSFGIIVSD